MKRGLRTLRDERGYALMTVTIFAFVIILAGVAFFGMSSGETRQALYRQSSAEAFYLADGAIERARARFLQDRSWTEGWTDVEAGRGTYSLTVTRTPWPADPTIKNVVRLDATGTVGRATRRIEAWTTLPRSSDKLVMLVYEDAGVLGGLCLDGDAHVNGTASPLHLSPGCNQEISGGFKIEPPLIYTEAEYFPGTTYYYARVEDIGGGVPGLRIYDRYFQPLTGQTNFLESFIGAPPNKYPPGFQISFNSAARLQEAFDEATGLFASIGGQPVVVNFGLPSPMMPGGLTYLEFDGSSSSVIRATIINTRFTGLSSPDSLRLNTDNWIGGWTFVKQVTFEPRLGVGLIAHNFQKSGGSLVSMGTTAWPCLVYLTGDVASYDLSAGVNSNFVLNGSLIVLGTWASTGGPSANYDPGFIDRLPEYLNREFTPGSGTMEILQWREVAAGT